MVWSYMESLVMISKMGMVGDFCDLEILEWLVVTPRFHGYGDVTATYIRRSENAPTHIR